MPDEKLPGRIILPFDQLLEKKKGSSIRKILEASSFLANVTSMKEVAEKGLRIVLKFFNLDIGRIYLLDESCGELILLAYYGIDDISGLERIRLGQGFTGKAVETKSLIAHHVDDLEDKARADLLRKKGINYVYCVPFVVMGKLQGAMNLGSKRNRMLKMRDIEAMMVIGHQIGITISHVRLFDDFNEKLKALQERKETIKFFAYSISHDLRSPVIGIYGLTKRLLEKYGDKMDEKAKYYCSHIMRAAEEVVKMVEDINSYVSAREAIEDPQYVDLEGLVKNVEAEFMPRLTGRNVKLLLQKDYPVVYGYHHLILRAMRNLIDNALKHGGDQLSKIEIGTEEDEHFWKIVVTDDGKGIPENRTNLLFQPFRRDSTKTEGAGLGLTIISEIAKKHGGSAWVESNPVNRRTSFYISIRKPVKEVEKFCGNP